VVIFSGVVGCPLLTGFGQYFLSEIWEISYFVIFFDYFFDFLLIFCDFFFSASCYFVFCALSRQLTNFADVPKFFS